jgi:hypothetical protein
LSMSGCSKSLIVRPPLLKLSLHIDDAVEKLISHGIGGSESHDTYVVLQ